MADARTGVFVGLMHDDYQFVHAAAQALEGPYGYMGNSFAMGSGRIAYALGLHGPAMTVDTACSSGLTAIHLACRSLHDGESDIALAGGASVMFEPRKAASGSAIGMLSPTGHCHAFDVAADGFVAGEGCVVMLLKRLPDALRRRRPDPGCDTWNGRQPRRSHGEHRDAVGTRTGRGVSRGIGCRRRGPKQHRHGGGARPRHPRG